MIAHGLRIDATANDGLVVAGQPIGVTVAVANRGGGELSRRERGAERPRGRRRARRGTSTLAAAYTCAAEGRVPAGAQLTDVYWERPEDAGRATFAADAPFGLPFRPSPFVARIELESTAVRVTRELPVQFRYEGAGLVGEKRMELNVVPAFAVGVSPAIVVVPTRSGAARDRRPGSARYRDQRHQGRGICGSPPRTFRPAGASRRRRRRSVSAARTSRRRRDSRCRRRRPCAPGRRSSRPW